MREVQGVGRQRMPQREEVILAGAVGREDILTLVQAVEVISNKRRKSVLERYLTVIICNTTLLHIYFYF